MSILFSIPVDSNYPDQKWLANKLTGDGLPIVPPIGSTEWIYYHYGTSFLNLVVNRRLFPPDATREIADAINLYSIPEVVIILTQLGQVIFANKCNNLGICLSEIFEVINKPDH